MSKSAKGKKNRVPKISEEEYAAYLTALKNASEGIDERVAKVEQPPLQGENG